MIINYKQFLFLCISTLLFTACSIKEPIVQTKNSDIEILAKTANDDSFNSLLITKDFFDKYFKPWNSTKVSFPKIEAMWGQSYKNKKVYLENHQLATTSWFDKQIENSNFDNYNTLAKKAITLKNVNIRVIPTNSPMFYDPTQPGEGFPFDYNQNSSIKINTPIIVSHLSKDRAWAYIESSTVGGWIEIGTIAFVDDNFIQEFKTSNYFISVKEKFPIYDPIFREYIKVATIFPKKNNKFIIAKKDDNQNALISYITLNNDEVEAMPLVFNSENRIKIAKQLIDEPYGWGGLLNNRDCSSFTQDYFATFGKFLHRNSKAQLSNGKYLDMSNLSNDEKKEFMKKNGVPFSTLVYLKGHIMLYIGVKENEPLVFHNIWSVRLKDNDGKKYRHIIGKATITTLEPGKDIKDFDEDTNILNRIQGIVIL
ncbi:C40 family peptidase [Arcobacter suis]|uniref:NlpC/P60 family lipoprotein (SH3b1, SH3b2 type SH3 domains) n=1 Tax=Arcobacter suis CECT 7833 TaxID=663365 RepID=A0AAD0WQQ4_9BACT|nr:SH3 domain-containing C40 family peptidase [Arcobacter suis]AXX89713.1 NlpC/P60 family lipoprotein (SH3b1, SH3b2 type SH3 domains) [Arcobacter suis CECT 7833]